MSIPRLEPTAPLAAFGSQREDTALIAALAGEYFRGNISRVPASGPPTNTSAASTRDAGLNGGFPTTSNSAPVHPTVVAAEPPSGGAPDRHDHTASYEFGEPVQDFGGSFAPAASSSSPKAFPSAWSGAPAESVEGLYFLPAEAAAASTPSGLAAGLDVEAVRRDFPALHQRVNGHPLIYLDNAATTHKPQAVLDATARFYGRDNANIHRAAHELAERATHVFESGREKVRQFLGAASTAEIVFLRGTTEAVNLVAFSHGTRNLAPGDEILITRLEHHANIVPWQLVAGQTGAVIRVAPINERGELILEEFARLLSPRTKIVSIAHVSNALGTINPVAEVIALAHAVGAVVLVDGAQSTPHLPVNVTALDADFYAFSGHKVFGPTGIGALYGKKHLLDAMPPWQGGGHMIQDVTFEKTTFRAAPEKFEAGTPDIAGVAGLGAAIDYLFKTGLPAIAAYEHALLEYATAALSTVPGLRFIGTAAEKASVLSFVIPGLSNDVIANHLDQRGIAVRAGHHCALPAQRHFGLETTVRPSLAFYNTADEVDALAAALRQLPSLRR